jgi:hypothetical protein
MLNQYKPYPRLTQFIGFLFFGTLFLLAWVYYKERILSFDSSFYAFQIIQSKTYDIELGRWGDILSQLLPVMALKNHCSLETFLRLYSISFIIIYYIIFLLCTLVFKNQKAGLALMLVLCLGFRWVFYYAVTEIHMAMALSILLWAIISSPFFYGTKLKKWIGTILSVILIYVMSYFHQLIVFPILFIIMLEFIGNKQWRNPFLWFIFLFAIIWFYIRIKILTVSEYEVNKILSFDDLKDGLSNFFHLSSFKYLVKFFISSLKSLCIVFILSLIIAALRRNWLLFTYLFLFPSGFIILIILIYYKGESPLMLQNYYPVVGLLVGVMFIYIIYDNLPKGLTLCLTALLLLINLKGVYNAHNIQTERIHYIDRLTQYGRLLPAKKYLLNDNNIPKDITSGEWAIPFETLLYSSLPSPDSAITFFYSNPMNKYDDLLNKENVFLGPNWAPMWFSSNTLYKDYFHLPSSGYLKVNTSQADSSFNESVFNDKNVSIKPLASEVRSNGFNFVEVPIKIINASGKRIYSTPEGDHPVLLSYHIYDENGKNLIWDNSRTTLEVDIKDEYTQGLMVYLPPKKGKYIVEVDFVTENVRWWNIKARFNLIVE